MKRLAFLGTKIVSWLDEMAIFLATALAAFISPIGHWLAIVGFLVVADMVTALIANNKAKKPIESRKLFRTIMKFVVYGIAVITGYIFELYFFPDLPVAKLMTAFIASIEIKSMDENYKAITGRSFFKFIIEALTKFRKEQK
jgi:hypothetical protein